jgi:16S rRNA (guanine966-N2)-methyltransferase
MRIIAGELRSRRLVSPENEITRPTTDRSREALFNALENVTTIENARVLDLFAGSGAVAFEALSRGAAHATLVEKDRRALEAIKQNMWDLDLSKQVKVISRDAYRAIEEVKGPFDIIFIDPPYRDKRVLEPLPVRVLELDLLTPEGILILEHSSHDVAVVPESATLLKNLKVGEATFTILKRKQPEEAA